MRDYFKILLENLHVITGLRQLEYLKDSEVSRLLDELLRVSNRFGYFSEKKKQSIIDNALLADEDLKKITPSKVYHWLSNAWQNLDAATRQKYINKDFSGSKIKDDALVGQEAQHFIDKWRDSLNNLDYSRLKPSKASERIMPNKGRKAIPIETTIVDCPGLGKEPCKGKGCGKCNGFGRIKLTGLR